MMIFVIDYFRYANDYVLAGAMDAKRYFFYLQVSTEELGHFTEAVLMMHFNINNWMHSIREYQCYYHSDDTEDITYHLD